MKTKRRTNGIEIEIATETKKTLTPRDLALIFSAMDSGQQADFFDSLWDHSKEWLSQQMVYVGAEKKFTRGARYAVETIGHALPE